MLRALGTGFSLTYDGKVIAYRKSTGAAEDMAHSSLRFGIGRFTTEAEVDFVVEHIIRTVHKLREMRFVFYYQVSFRYADFFFASQSTMGDGSGRNRYQLYRLVSALAPLTFYPF